MICTTIRQGSECPFMAQAGCSYIGGRCLEIVDPCRGCNRTAQFPTGTYCTNCPDPSLKWKNGNCNMATHVSISVDTETKQKINPLKASKRGNR